MGIAEVAVFTAAEQLAQTVASYLGKITPPPSNPWAAAALVVGKQLANNAANAFGAAVDAATAEFKETQKAEAKILAQLAQLPPVI